MKIRTHVGVSLIIFVILISLIIFSVYSSNNQLQEINRKLQIIEEIEKGSFELYYLENDYFLHGGTRPFEQWNSKYGELSGLLKELKITDPGQQAEFNALSDAHTKLQATFSNFVALTMSAQGKESISASQELEEFTWSTLAGQTQTMMFKSSELSQQVKAESHEVQQRTTLIISFSLALLMVFVSLNYLFINRSVLRSISTLQKGTERIGSGDLDTKIETGSSDELGDLSLAFNAMTSNLKTARTLLLTSNSELKWENAERKRVEEALRESKERYRNVVEDQTEFICRFLPDGTHIFVNDAYCRYFDKKRDEIIGHRFNLLLHPEDREIVARHIASLTPLNPVMNIDQRIIMPDGSTRWQRWSDRAIFNADGQVAEYQSVGRDITERKEAERALLESETRLHAVVHGSPIPKFVIDKNHCIIYWNKALEEHSGIKASEVVGTNQQWKAFYPNERPCMADLLVDGAIERIPQWYKEKYRKSDLIDGAYEATDFFPKMGTAGTWLFFTAAVIRDSKGIVIGAVETLEDITERKKAEDKLRTFNEELEQGIKERTSKLNASLQEKVVLLREIHHRVKNNLQIVISLLNLQTRQIRDENVRKMIQESQNRIKVMALVHEKLYRSENISHIILSEYIKNLVTILLDFYVLDRSLVTAKVDMKDITLNIDTAIPIGLIINELVSNSLKHAFPEGRKGEIAISVQEVDHTLTILYKDNGVGIPEGFDWRNATSLGLRLVISLVEQISGTITLNRDSGTEFTMIVMEK